MADVTATLKPTGAHLPLPSINAGDTYVLSFNTGPNQGRNGAVTVFTDGPNIFADHCWVTAPDGSTVATSGTGGNSVQIYIGKAYAVNTVYTLHLPVDGDGGAKYDYNPPAVPHSAGHGHQ